jgi:hypothetical protein
MTKHEELGANPFGRCASIQRLVYRPSSDERQSASRRSKGWTDTREWGAIKDKLRRTVRQAPEVVIKVSGSRRGKDDDREAIAGVLRYMMYISRNGRLEMDDEMDDSIKGHQAVRDMHASWDLDMQRLSSPRGEALHPSFNIIFSMPAHTEAEKMLSAVQAFARENFRGHQYVMVLHTNETDPADDPPEHPHVHAVLRAEDQNGRRIHIRKGTLRGWREAFATELRAHGIEANATSRAERGKPYKSKRGAEWHIDKRAKAGKGPLSHAMQARLCAAAKELEEGHTELKPWEIAMAARRRDVVRNMRESAARLREEGDVQLAAEVDKFIDDIPPVDTERRQMQRALVRQVQDRLRKRTRDMADKSK